MQYNGREVTVRTCIYHGSSLHYIDEGENQCIVCDKNGNNELREKITRRTKEDKLITLIRPNNRSKYHIITEFDGCMKGAVTTACGYDHFVEMGSDMREMTIDKMKTLSKDTDDVCSNCVYCAVKYENDRSEL